MNDARLVARLGEQFANARHDLRPVQLDAGHLRGGSIWLTGSYDPRLNLTYWGVGNVGPDYNGAQRPGDNLYTASIVALDADTGKLKWHCAPSHLSQQIRVKFSCERLHLTECPAR